jgi:hypothetical protein
VPTGLAIASQDVNESSPDLSHVRSPWHAARQYELARNSADILNESGLVSLETVKRVVDEAGDGVERIDMFNYGEPFLYRHLTAALRHIRMPLPGAQIAISTDGMQVREVVEQAMVEERLLDWVNHSPSTVATTRVSAVPHPRSLRRGVRQSRALPSSSRGNRHSGELAVCGVSLERLGRPTSTAIEIPDASTSILTATRTLSATGAGPGSPCRGDDGFFGRATLAGLSPSAALGRATLGPVASRASPSAVRLGAPPLLPRR